MLVLFTEYYDFVVVAVVDNVQRRKLVISYGVQLYTKVTLEPFQMQRWGNF